jgi:hypothetical protein
MKIDRKRLLVGIGSVVVCAALVAVWTDTPTRTFSSDERLPDKVVLKRHQKFGGETLRTITNREEIVALMSALPLNYGEPYCACFGQYLFEFYAPTGVYRTISYKSDLFDSYLRDSSSPTGQSSVPRKFKRVVRNLLSNRDVKSSD